MAYVEYRMIAVGRGPAIWALLKVLVVALGLK